MKCSNPNCNRGIGLVAYGRGWFRRRNYCSRECRDSFVAEGPKQSQQEGSATTNFEWLFLQPIEKRQPKLMPAVVRVRAKRCSLLRRSRRWNYAKVLRSQRKISKLKRVF
jgi:hypothetical protein